MVTPGVVGSSDQHESAFGEVGLVSVPLKVTSSDLNCMSKKEHHQDFYFAIFIFILRFLFLHFYF